MPGIPFFVRGSQVVGIIDFERALWAEPLMEAQFRPLFSGDGVTSAMRGYDKTFFSFAEEQRYHLYSLHLALVMDTECYYRHGLAESKLSLFMVVANAAHTSVYRCDGEALNEIDT